MGNKLRFRSGQVQLIKVRVDSSTVIEAGDMLYLDGDDVKPSGMYAWDTDLATTQASFAALFLGIAHQSSGSGDTDAVSVDVSPNSVYEFDAAAGVYEVGDLVGPDENSGALHSQQLESVASSSLAIARAAEYRSASSSLLRVTFASAFQTGSANVNATLG